MLEKSNSVRSFQFDRVSTRFWGYFCLMRQVFGMCFFFPLLVPVSLVFIMVFKNATKFLRCSVVWSFLEWSCLLFILLVLLPSTVVDFPLIFFLVFIMLIIFTLKIYIYFLYLHKSLYPSILLFLNISYLERTLSFSLLIYLSKSYNSNGFLNLKYPFLIYFFFCLFGLFVLLLLFFCFHKWSSVRKIWQQQIRTLNLFVLWWGSGMS